MKTKLILLGAVVAAFTASTFAAGPLLSPRSAGNQFKTVNLAVEAPAAITTPVAVAPVAAPKLLSPRAQGNQIIIVKATGTDLNPALACRKAMGGCPRVVGECTAHTTMPGCVTVAMVK